MSQIFPPAAVPCGSCPYRRDVPSGIWHPSEYAKLPAYDLETGSQPHGVFLCHQQDGRVCAGWCGAHDMGESLALRLGAITGVLSDATVRAMLDYSTNVPLFESGAAASAHGMLAIHSPSDKALSMAVAITRKKRNRE